MNTKNIMLVIWNQLTRKGAWRNIFVTHNAFGIFSQYSHISRRSGKPKVAIHFFLTSSLRHPKILIKEFSYFLMPCHQHGLRINLLV